MIGSHPSEDHHDDDHPHNSKKNDVQPARTLEAMQRARISVGELCLYYLSMGGDIEEYEITAYLHGLMQLPAIDRDMISQSVNEMYDDICRRPRAPFSADFKQHHERTSAHQPRRHN